MEAKGTSAFGRPVSGPVETAASRAAALSRHRFRLEQPAWAPVLVSVLGFLAMVGVLFVVGEALTRSGLFAAVRDWDLHVNQTLADHRNSGLDRFSELGSKLADTWSVVIVGLLVEGVLALRRRWRDLLVVFVGLTVELSVFFTVNETVRRPRPSVVRLGSVPSTFSFPSGHTAATVVLYGTIVLLVTLNYQSALPKVLGWLFVLFVTAAVGYARVYRGMHHVTDVTAGALMGLGSLTVAVIATRASSLAMERESVSEPGRHGAAGELAHGRRSRELSSSEGVQA